MAVGRISGPLLKANLLREGINLAFETDLLYLDVNNSRIGIRTSSPEYDLDVNGTIRSSNLSVSTLADIADITIAGNTISTTQPTLNLGTADTVIYQNKLTVDSIDVENNVISTNSTNKNLELRPNGTGTVEIFADTNVYGNIVATGSITADGNITIGDANTDNVTFNAEIASNIIPDANSFYDLGSNPNTGGKQWRNVWADNIYANSATINTSDLIVDGIELALRQGNIYYVAENGNDLASGDHPSDPFASLNAALAVATDGDTIHIYPGTYLETFPMTIPAGVTVKGHSLRSVNIKPTVATQNNDAFLLNGGVTVEDLTVKDFYNGYAFKFAPGFTVTGRSPYIRNISVITQGSVTSGADPRGFAAGDAGKGAFLDGSVATINSNEASCLFHSVTFITPGVDCIVLTNGVRVEWLNSFTYFADRSIYAYDGTTGLKGAGKTALRLTGLTGTINAGETISYYDTNGITLLASATIDSIDSTGKIFVNGKKTGFQTANERGGKTIQAFGDAKLSTSIKKFGTASLALDGNSDYAFVQSTPDFAFSGSRVPKSITLNDNVAISSLQSKFGSRSIAFDGTNDYLSIPSSADFGFGTGDFTIEAWVYKNDIVGVEVLFDFRTAGNQAVPTIYFDTSNLFYYVSGAVRITKNAAITANSWNHIAVSRLGTNTQLFVNGVSVGSWVDTTDYVASPCRIGVNYLTTGSFSGYIDEIRISKGTARYSTNFTPLTAPFTNDASTVLLVHGDTNITDDVGAPQDNFTIEGWFYRSTNFADSQMLFDFRTTGTQNAPCLFLNNSSNLYYLVGGTNRITALGAMPSTATWYHVALSRSGTNTRLFVNGVQVGSTWVDTTNYVQSSLTLGSNYLGSQNFNGYIDDFRISKGIARYSSNFTVPLSILPNDQYTVLLSRFDGANGSTSLIDETNLPQDIRFSGGATASAITLTDFTDFGAEVRLIASASIYGNYGLVGDGPGVLMYAIGQNLAYIGNGKEVTNDPLTVIQANEVVELNNARIRYSSVDHQGDFRVGELFYVDQQTGTVNFTSANFNISTSTGISITTGSSTTTITGEHIDTGNLRISGNTVSSTTGDIILSAASGTVRIDDTGAFNLTSGTTAERPAIPELGMMRYNTDTNLFEGYDGNWIALNGVYSLDLDTYITAELTPGANDNTIRFYANGALVADLTEARFRSNRLEVDNIAMDANTISTIATDTDLVINSSGTGTIKVDDFSFKNSTILNTVADGVTYFRNSGSGYFNIEGTGGFVVPVGTDLQRPAPLYREIGMIRFNTNQGYLEVWNGVSWVSVAGSSGAITFNAAENLAIEYVLTLG